MQEGRTEADADAFVAALGGDWRAMPLADADRAMLAYAVKLTLTPGAMAAGDVAALRAAGFDDAGIHDVCSVTAYFAFVNRIADGLGVELEQRFGPA